MGRAVNSGGFIVGTVDARDGSQIDYGIVSRAFPDVNDQQNGGPERRGGVKVDFFKAKAGRYGINGTVFISQQAAGKNTYYHGGDKVGEEGEGLGNFL